jgi:signal transduction histidine kinase/CheY-like chemotaxis protein
MTDELVRVEVRDTAGAFSARQVGREVAAELGLERQDQVRVATALSEVGRELIIAGQVATMIFLAGDSELIIQVQHGGPPPQAALAAAARLMDRVTTTGPVLELARHRPAGRRPDLGAIRSRLAALLPVSALDELRRQNEDLIGALAQVQQQKAELLLLNAELEETNQGVMALYSQLSDELEQTNRGVVALYAELEEKSERLREASEAKNRFWANVSHELRSPLNSIIGLGRLLTSAGSDLTADQRHQAGLIVGAGLGLLELVNDLLDTAKAEAGQLLADPSVVELPALLARLRALLRPMTENRPVSLIVDAADAPAELLTDEVALTAILRNLLSNGLKYTDDGEVRLTVSTAAGHVDFAVTDTGIGIPADQTERVFEEFFQVSGVRRGGTGLGLPYARRLTELLGGHLSLASQPGRGTTVTLRLPHGTPALGVVLIADDDAGFRQVVRGLLAGLAGRVIEAADGEQALAAVLAGPVDLALVDLRMPGLDGYALLERLPGDIPAIIISSQDPGELPPGASGVLRKDQLTADRLRYAINRIKAINQIEGAGDG